jgi:hypothetical protein
MAQGTSLEILLAHPVAPSRPGAPSASGNLYWRYDAQAIIDELWPTASALLEKHGYWISRFPQGDGAAFTRQPYDPAEALVHFQRAFPGTRFTLGRPDEVGRNLARLHDGAMVHCTILVPVEHLLLWQKIALQEFTIYPAVNGDTMTLAEHPWGMELCDIPGADADPQWYPDPEIGLDRRAGLLRYPLIELRIDVPVSLIHLAGCSVIEAKPLTDYVLEVADRCLDLIRVNFCHHRRLEYTPGRAGRVADGTSVFYLMPEHPALQPHLHQNVTDVLSVRNNWLELEIDSFSPSDIDRAAARIIMGRDDRANQGVIRHALRSLGTSLYLVLPEACFLQLIYALDAVAAVDVRAEKHRRYIAALTCNWDDDDPAASRERFQKRLAEFSDLYNVRNRIVHSGGTFATLQRDGTQATATVFRFVMLCCERLLSWNLRSNEEVRQHVADVLGKIEAE